MMSSFPNALYLFRRRHLGMAIVLTALLTCCEEPEVINSIVLGGGAYVQITNRQVVGQPLDSTSLAALNNDVFSLEIRAAGDTLPAGITESPTLFMISNAAGDDEIGLYRDPFDSSQIIVYLGHQFMGLYTVLGCDWNDPDVFTQVVLTYDGATLKVYGNGELLGTRTPAVDLDVGLSHALIGADWDAFNDPSTLSNFWYGAIDEVRLWTKVLPVGEMAFRYQNPDKLTKNYSPTGLDLLLGLWRFNQRGGDGSEVPDGSGKGNDGVLNAGEGRLDFTDAGA